MIEKNTFKLDNYNTIILDCDGVILNSNKIKTNAFRKTLNNYNFKKVKKFIAFHEKNIGLNRFEKFNYFFKQILNKKNFNNEVENCLKKFSTINKEKLIHCRIDNSLNSFIKYNSSKKFIVISAAEQKELKIIFKEKKIYHYFYRIYGSPKSKTDNFKKILKNKNCKEPYLYLGDSKNDYVFAKSNNIDFVFIYHWTIFKNWKNFCKSKNLMYVKDLKYFLSKKFYKTI